MSTGFSTRKMRQGAARSSSSTVPRTTVQRSTSRSSESTVPQTTTRTSIPPPNNSNLGKSLLVFLCGTHMETSTRFIYFIREWRHYERNTNRRTMHHRLVNPTTTHHCLQSCSKCQHRPADHVNSPSMGRYTKNQKNYLSTWQTIWQKVVSHWLIPRLFCSFSYSGVYKRRTRFKILR